jgi:hypothetical protein
MTELTYPLVHMNGTSKDELLRGYLLALHHIDEAIQTLGATCPHGRDYYPRGYSALDEAMAQHRARLQKLHDAKTELEALAYEVSKQGRGK